MEVIDSSILAVVITLVGAMSAVAQQVGWKRKQYVAVAPVLGMVLAVAFHVAGAGEANNIMAAGLSGLVASLMALGVWEGAKAGAGEVQQRRGH